MKRLRPAVVLGCFLSATMVAGADQLDSKAKAEARQQILRSRQSLAEDPFRPLYHFSSPKGKLWDPGGFCKWQGRYHLFYIGWGGKGHAVSDDLVHWQDLPPVQKISGLTGQMITTADTALLTVTKARDGVQLATSSDPMLQEWEVNTVLPLSVLKGYQGPIDSCIWEEDGVFFIGLRKQTWEKGFYHLRGSKPELSVYRSKDLKQWDYDGVLLREDSYTQPGDDFACPNFLPIGQDRRLLLWFNHPRGAMYQIGTYERQKPEQKFLTEYHGQMQYGSVKLGSLHAPSAFPDSAESCLSIFNVSENLSHPGWEGTMSLPRHLSLHTDYLTEHTARKGFRNFFSPLQIEPPPALKTLRFNPVEIGGMELKANREIVIPEVRGKAIEMEIVIDPKDAREVELRVLRSPDGNEQTKIRFFMQGWQRNKNARALSIDVSEASLAPEVQARPPETGLLYLEDKTTLRLRVFVDRSIIEVFANNRQCLTVRAYPTREDSSGISLVARGSDATLMSLHAWQMRSIWPELKAREGN